MLYILVCLEAAGGLHWWLDNGLFTLTPYSLSVRSSVNAPSSCHDDVTACKEIPCKRQWIATYHEIHRIDTTYHMVSESFEYMQNLQL